MKNNLNTLNAQYSQYSINLTRNALRYQNKPQNVACTILSLEVIYVLKELKFLIRVNTWRPEQNALFCTDVDIFIEISLQFITMDIVDNGPVGLA